MSRCGQEMCGNWSGDGDVCPCSLFDYDLDNKRKAAAIAPAGGAS